MKQSLLKIYAGAANWAGDSSYFMYDRRAECAKIVFWSDLALVVEGKDT